MNNQLSKFFQYFIPALFGLSLYFLFFLPIEFLLTEVYFVIPKINPWFSVSVLFFFLLIANLFNWKKIAEKKWGIKTFAFFVFISFVFYGFYHQEKLFREYLPKIHSVSPAWVIQGQEVKIKGVNFGRSFKKGKVSVDGMDFLIRDWSENKIVVEAPVPAKVGRSPIFVRTEDGLTSNLFSFEVKDPNELREFLR